jgi:divalent metal cation (Fe/Co/Zn/Cd) transporter
MKTAVVQPQTRSALVLSGKHLEYFTVLWHLLEGIISLVAGLASGSLSLVGFGVDSLIELASGVAIWWRMAVDDRVEHREHNEKLALRLIGGSFMALAVYLIFESVASFVNHKAPEPSVPGLAIAVLSLVVMPLLSRAKRNLAIQLKSPAMQADAKQADFCAYLSAILLVGLAANFWLRWWWADPVAALFMAAIIGNEGLKTSLGDPCCEVTR